MIERRAFVVVIAGSTLVTPSGLNAQTAPKPPRVALVLANVPLAEMAGPDPAERWTRVFVHGLRDLGYVEGRNIVIERRSDEGRPERMPALIQELVASKVDVIVTTGASVGDAWRAIGTIPIVMFTDDPEAVGMTASLARPTRNITGVLIAAGPEILGKRLQLLKEAAPKSARVAVIDFKYIDSQATPGTHRRRREIEAAARLLGVTPILVGVDTREDLEPAFAAITRERADALLVVDQSTTHGHRSLIIDFAARHGLPAVYDSRVYAESGGLMSYGSNLDDQWRRTTAYVDKILKGARPGDLPFQKATKFELVINRKTAKALGLTMPPLLLLRADEVIE